MVDEREEGRLCLNGVWRLYIAENRECDAFADDLCTYAELEKSGFLQIDGRVPGNFELDVQAAGLLPDLYFGENTLLAANAIATTICAVKHRSIPQWPKQDIRASVFEFFEEKGDSCETETDTRAIGVPELGIRNVLSLWHPFLLSRA